MARKALAVAIIAVISSVAPATAVIGFCAQMPCCFKAAHEVPSLASGGAGCCTTINCYEAPPHDATRTESVKALDSIAPALVFAGPVIIAPVSHVRPLDDGSPPRATADRLAALSTLLI